jgi:triphosphoribosyl-dephospho-CoA synthase
MEQVVRHFSFASPSPLRACTKQRTFCLEIAILAVRSLHAELVLYPKPGLVSLIDRGSHSDMDADLFMRSLFSLRHYFVRMAHAGANKLPFGELKALGVQAERRMLAATGGINTHRGAIFSLGLLCAAAGYCRAHAMPLTARMIRSALLTRWGDALTVHSLATPDSSHGSRAAELYAIGGAREEAAKGFPSVFEISLPQLRNSLARGRSQSNAQLDALFSLMAHIADTNLYHRGGKEGAILVRQLARRFISLGGTAHPGWYMTALDLHRQFVGKRLSPGGAADLLSATWFVHQVTEVME